MAHTMVENAAELKEYEDNTDQALDKVFKNYDKHQGNYVIAKEHHDASNKLDADSFCDLNMEHLYGSYGDEAVQKMQEIQSILIMHRTKNKLSSADLNEHFIFTKRREEQDTYFCLESVKMTVSVKCGWVYIRKEKHKQWLTKYVSIGAGALGVIGGAAWIYKKFIAKEN
eukprot:63116_1